jgi:hypothetical protein
MISSRRYGIFWHQQLNQFLSFDPYLDETIFDGYLTSVSLRVSVRLLTLKYAAALKPAAAHFVAQTHMTVEARKSDSIHDRVLFLDDIS